MKQVKALPVSGRVMKQVRATCLGQGKATGERLTCLAIGENGLPVLGRVRQQVKGLTCLGQGATSERAYLSRAGCNR